MLCAPYVRGSAVIATPCRGCRQCLECSPPPAGGRAGCTGRSHPAGLAVTPPATERCSIEPDGRQGVMAMRTFGRVPVRSRWFRAWVTVIATGLLVGTALWPLPPGAPSASPTPSSAAAVGTSPAPTSPGAPGSAATGPSANGWQPYVLPPEAQL